MKKYMIFAWVIDGTGWYIKDNLEEAKDVWCFGKLVFEVDAEDVQELINYAQECKSNRLMIAKLNEVGIMVQQDGEPPTHYVTK